MHYFIVVLMAFALSMYGCEGKTGPAGATGPSGAAGPAGPAGADGRDGAPGPQGEQGPAGPKGDTGAAGADGADGAPGPKGDKGDKGDPGEDGEDGAGADPGAIQDIIDGVVAGGALADIHHVVIGYLDEDGDTTGEVTYYAPNFEPAEDKDALSFNLGVGDTRQLVVKAGSQDEEKITVVPSFESDDPVNASVSSDGEIEANRAGGAVIMVGIVGRGITIGIDVDVLAKVDKVTISSAKSIRLPVGGSADVTAKATDADGDEVDTKITLTTSDDSVASVDGLTITAESVGTATIKAVAGGTTSKDKITVVVTPAGAYSHTITHVPVAASSRTIDVPVDGDGKRRPTATSADAATLAVAISGPTDGIVYKFQVNEIGADGMPTRIVATVADITLGVDEYGQDVLKDIVSVTSGDAGPNYTLAVDSDGVFTLTLGVINSTPDIDYTALVNDVDAGKDPVHGDAYINVSYEGAETIALPAVIVATKAP